MKKEWMFQPIMKMDRSSLNNWIAGIFGGTVSFVTYLCDFAIINWNEVFDKLITALVVGFAGGATGVLGKMFIVYCRKKVTQLFNRFFNKKPASK